MNEVEEGKVKWFNNEKGYGFIERENGLGDCFCHYSSISGSGFKTLSEGDRVSFRVESNDRGEAAVDVVLIDKAEEGPEEK